MNLSSERRADGAAETARAAGSWILHGVDRWSAHPWIAGSIVAADAVWVVFSITQEFPTRLESIFQTLVAALTLAMVFVIQHTQSKLSMATQRKLDEILRALPGANEALIRLEHAPISDIEAAAQAHDELRDAVINPDQGTH